MAEAFLGEIRMVGFNFAPMGWASCDGAILSISQNTALFALLGTYYGGNGISTFGLPDLRGRAPIHRGQGPGLANYDQGEAGGAENVTLISSEMPAHNHSVNSSSAPGNTRAPGGAVLAKEAAGQTAVYATNPPMDSTLHPATISPAGSNHPHENRSPYLTVNFVIALEGIFPSRN